MSKMNTEFLTRLLKATIASLSLLVLAACVTPPSPKDYTAFRAANPRSILVVPVINNSNEAEAPDLFLTTLSMPLAEKGYYVFPINMVKDMMAADGMADPYLVHSTPTPTLAALFGADTVLYIEILSWDSQFVVTASNIVVKFIYTLKDGHTDDVLWQDEAEYVHQMSAQSGNIFADIVVAAITTAINNVAVDYTPVAKAANAFALNRSGFGMPAGPYSPGYAQDTNVFQSTGTGVLSNTKTVAVATGGVEQRTRPEESNSEEEADGPAENSEVAEESAETQQSDTPVSQNEQSTDAIETPEEQVTLDDDSAVEEEPVASSEVQSKQDDNQLLEASEVSSNDDEGVSESGEVQDVNAGPQPIMPAEEEAQSVAEDAGNDVASGPKETDHSEDSGAESSGSEQSLNQTEEDIDWSNSAAVEEYFKTHKFDN